MKRLRVLFALALLLTFLPLWRLLDYQVFVWPSSTLYTMSFLCLSLFSLILPFRLLKPAIKKRWSFAIFVVLGMLSYLGSPLSGKATLENDLRHCGAATFTGFAYHLSPFLTSAYQDDFEARNQSCWVRKMITRAPVEIDDVTELQNYLDLIRKKLLSPERKYRATLPLIAFLHGSLSATLTGNALESVQIGQMFVESLKFWKEQYTDQISAREYPWWNWPHSEYIKWEYGLIERNWETLVESIQVEN